MKTTLACRRSPSGIFIANKLAQEGLVHSIIIESGKPAKQAKLRRLLKGKNLIQYPIMFLDIVANGIYSTLCRRYLKNNLLQPNDWRDFPKGIKQLCVDDINEQNAIQFIKDHSIETLVVCGTSILKKEIISVPKTILNIHGGIVPTYRNVHCDFWAYHDNDFDGIGTSIIYLDEGVDSGDVALQKAVDFKNGDGLCIIKRKNLELAANMTVDAIHKLSYGQLPRQKQADTPSKKCPTPTCLDLVATLIQVAKNKLLKQ